MDEYSLFVKDLEQQISTAGFKSSAEFLKRMNMSIPEFGTVYMNDFSVLLTIEASWGELESVSGIQEALKKASEWILMLVKKLELQGFLIDSYLVFVLQSAPSTEHGKAGVRQIEQDPALCRKHVIWPKVKGDIDTLQTITVLGLPEEEDKTVLMNDTFKLSEMAEDVVNKTVELGSIERMLEELRGKYAYKQA